MDFKNIPKEYRPIPFWSWNEKLNEEETKEQVGIMHNAGIGGFFMHARGGLQTEYMSDEWFENIEVAKSEAKKLNMKAWAYDENGWPSGFGNGYVNGLGIEYQQKYLRMSDKEPDENVICKLSDKWFYYEVNPFYVDVLDKKVIAEFIKYSYQPYYDRFKNEIEGIFTDEPQVSRNGIPWSFVFEDEYKKRYNENIVEVTDQLFMPIGDYKKTRIKFWKMVTDLFSSSYFKQIYEWCDLHKIKFTGHLAIEETFETQTITSGACMPHYEYFHIPGMDWLGRRIYDCLTPRQVSSVSEQLGKKQVLSESFALCGHNVSFEELKGIYEWQTVRGINLLCQHLEGYSIRGMRKRDFPPAMYYQQPWWKGYKSFVDAMSREGMILTECEKKVEVLLIHPQITAWTLYDDNKNDGISELNERFLQEIKKLEEKHIVFHLGDETIIERHGKVVKDKFVIGNQEYRYVLNPCGAELLDNTKKLLGEFKNNGGKLNIEPPENKVIDRKDITYTFGIKDGKTIHFFVNTSNERKSANVLVPGKKIDAFTGEESDFCGKHEFEPWGSLLISEEDAVQNQIEISENKVNLPKRWHIADCEYNTLTLDKCDYYFDGKLEEKNGFVLNITERANKLERKVNIRQDFRFKAEYIPKELFLVCETPDKFEISINGKTYKQKAVGYYRDKSFVKLDISGYAKLGDNTVTLICDFLQSDDVYENIKKAYVFESEKNKLVYDMEIEAVYLLGDFSVRTDGKWEKLDKNAGRYYGEFILDKPKTIVEGSGIQKQGFPFFCGDMTLEGEIDIENNSYIEFDKRGINIIKVEIDDWSDILICDFKMHIPKKFENSKRKIRLTLTNNLRNMLGPHHLKEGECIHLNPFHFFKEPCVWKACTWNENPDEIWDDDYCFVEVTI